MESSPVVRQEAGVDEVREHGIAELGFQAEQARGLRARDHETGHLEELVADTASHAATVVKRQRLEVVCGFHTSRLPGDEHSASKPVCGHSGVLTEA
jgi:hypothetical protein